tara:strand:+ start:2570 stop:3835 length:1266 start_codon:yes stop_codon:yes gene_type:complete
MIVGIIGSGGREHALCLKLNQSKIIEKIYCFPGNAGTNLIANNIEINISDFKKIKKICEEKKIEMLVVGPEKPLVEGISDYFKNSNIKIFGPNKLASQLEGSKTFTKKICKKFNIPTSKFEIFESKAEALKFLKNSKFPIVVKADGLASGKGVYICKKFEESKKAIEEIFEGRFGIANLVLIEEFLIGEEMSYFIISDGKTFKSFQSAQDHKRVGEGDTGPNTGGMGAYSPSRLNSDDLEDKINRRIILPTLKGLNDLGTNYVGFLYVGLMIVNNEPYLIEYNVRMGDPECQTILPLLNSDLGEIIKLCCDEKLELAKIEWLNKKSLCVVLCSKGYPGAYKKNVKIDNLENLKTDENQFIIHAGTKFEKNNFYAIGGRVLNVIAISDTFGESKMQTDKILKKINWKDGFYRSDIGYKVISK